MAILRGRKSGRLTTGDRSLRKSGALSKATTRMSGESQPSAVTVAEDSTHGRWLVEYNGYGTVQSTTNGTFTLQTPWVAAGSTTAALVTSTSVYSGDVTIRARMRTLQQRPDGTNPWEVAWLYWGYRREAGAGEQGIPNPDEWIRYCYYIALKPNGWELGKLDQKTFTATGGQRYIGGGSTPTYAVGQTWRDVVVSQVGATITVAVDGANLVTFTDGPGSGGTPTWQEGETVYTSGGIGMYCEDSHVEFADITVTSGGATTSWVPDDGNAGAVLRSTGEVPLATTANRPVPAPLRGVTTEQVGALTTLDNALKTHSRPPTVRIVFQNGTDPSHYSSAIATLRPHAYIMGCILDSTAVSEYTQAQVTDRTRSFVQAFGADVDIWEIGNELNGEWVGTQSEINAKSLAAYNVVKVENAALNLKAAVTLNYWPSTNCYAQTWEELNTFATGMPATVKNGVDYALISFYETACSPPEQPTVTQFTTTLNNMSIHFPNAKVGFGEVGWQGVASGFPSNPTVAERKAIANRYYGMYPQLQANIGERFIGGYFWWNYYQDIVQAAPANSLWGTIDAHIKTM